MPLGRSTPPPRDEPGPDSPGLRNGAREGTLQPYRLYGWFKPLSEVSIYLANKLAYPQSTRR